MKKIFFKKRNRKRIRRKQRYRFVYKFILLILSLSSLWVGAAYFAKRSQFFALSEVKIQGTFYKLDPEKVKQVAGLTLGVNLFQINLDELKSKVLQLGDIKSVFVNRKLPTHLVIYVEEYRPIFILRSNDAYFYVDQGGAVFKEITQTQDSRDFPYLTGMSTVDAQAIQLALNLRESYQKKGLDNALPISELNFDKNNGFTLYPEKKKYSIKIGSDHFDDKFQKLFLALDQINHSDGSISSVDLNYLGKILVKL
ncbi:MAG: FtsQ-type POTRA domain-containing protein [Deltaproteobacteria bacterium]|nr:FtsQ-type POTRA domain-containing protein [Deltaproteobacteria bacterium]